jgi:hypothetical protein
MPQLDQINFFPQVMWLIITFLILYTVFLKDYTPFVFKVNKMRQEKISNHYDSIVFFDHINVEVLYARWNSLKRLFV